ncbi:hypothetical protein NADFUDRAFT_46525 [Nadsonia fulvescens var. elongata DSM 6958]|uniref:Crh-like protein n=1 Tax=Nadsonia fulvescens var. elongata DSM 6958 TaxID=857566 RepID=A0A1E3PKJ1_9ASCO|nr:hypothetical protein NADFUDRAFT_46525 [Nadsonia fulvescens var. elongata DSM 6958]
MKFLIKTAILSAFSLISLASAANEPIACDIDNKCPEDVPCCSLYGQCGTGAYCLGGCDPRMSFNISSCMPMPVCQSRTDTFKDLSSIVSNSEYLGDASKHGWVSSGQILQNADTVLLAMPKNSVGAVLASTDYMWYGKVTATMKSSRDQGVISSFILMSDVKDEIDYEFVGKDLETVQTNFYWQGALNWTNSQNISLSDTFENYHTYEIEWTEDVITWSVDGQVGRTLKKADTYNATTNQYQFPQTPSRMQLSIWPGGASSNAPGTIAWSGGALAWDGSDLEDPGFYYVTISEITVDCYSAPSGTETDGSKAYVYKNANALASDVKITDDNTVLGSFAATGNDPDRGADDSSSSAAAAVPTGAVAGGDANRGNGSSSSSSSSSNSGGSASKSDSSSSSGSASKSSSSSSASSSKSSGTSNSASSSSDATTTSNTKATTSTSQSDSATTSDKMGGWVQNSKQTSTNTITTANSGTSRTLVSSFLVIAVIASAMAVLA